MLAGLPLMVKYGAAVLGLLLAAYVFKKLVWVFKKSYDGVRADEREDAWAERAEGYREIHRKLVVDDKHGRVRDKSQWPESIAPGVSPSVEPDILPTDKGTGGGMASKMPDPSR